MLQYSKVESLLLKAMKGKDFTEEFEFICALYETMLALLLSKYIETLATQISQFYWIKYMKHLSPSQLPMFSEIVILLKIVLINSSTNSASERSFSAMRRITMYLMSSMSQAH